jgi:RNA polymerase sigma-70 factor (ECF subfamily)
MIEHLRQVPSTQNEPTEMEVEFQKSVFRWAAERIQGEFHPKTWQAFWMTVVEGLSCEDAAERLEKDIGSIYAARSRVIRRLKNKIEEFDDSCQIE